ncbi:MAG: hypothetical protein HZA77_08345 [Candidatus Schekmanbacteria bacterium]|nr:hypothetical protein [Candidatus Schekmanbacteria bacterium]
MRKPKSILITYLFLSIAFIIFINNIHAGEITLAPVIDGTVTKHLAKGFGGYGSYYNTSSIPPLSYTHLPCGLGGWTKRAETISTSLENDNIELFEYYKNHNGVIYENYRRIGILEFDISSLSTLQQNTFTAELLFQIDNSSIPAHTGGNQLIILREKEENQDGAISAEDSPRTFYCNNQSGYSGVTRNYYYPDSKIGTLITYSNGGTLPITGTLISVDVTSDIESEISNISSNNYAGFLIFWNQLYIANNCFPYSCNDPTIANSPLISFTDSSEAGTYAAPVLRIITNEPTAITLSSFSATSKDKKVSLAWQTTTEIDNIGFNILRSESETGPYTKINKKLIKSKGSSTKGASYKLKDKNIEAGKTYWYKLEDIDSNTGPSQHDAVKVEVTAKKIKSKK